jgi:hypothetical protein
MSFIQTTLFHRTNNVPTPRGATVLEPLIYTVLHKFKYPSRVVCSLIRHIVPVARWFVNTRGMNTLIVPLPAGLLLEECL